MRKVKVGAIQPAYIQTPQLYSCAAKKYRNDPEEIVENYVRQQLDVTAVLLEKAGGEGCDIVTTSEGLDGVYPYSIDVTERNIYDDLLQFTQPVIEKELSAIARKYSMYVIGCYNKRVGKKNYNSAVIFDRKGLAAGEYRKSHLPSDEKWQNTEGDDIPVFTLDFGRIGISICYDIMFPEHMQVLSLKGAEIVFHPTLGYGWYESIGEATLRTRANDGSVYIVTSKNYMYNSPGRSSIIDYWGHILADAGYGENAVISREIDLDVPKAQPDWYFPVQTSGIQDMKERKAGERRPELYTMLSLPVAERIRTLDRGEQQKVLKRIRAGECHW